MVLDNLDNSPEEEDTEPAHDTPLDLRPDLTEIGLEEIERGVVEDTYDNRSALRRAKFTWDPVYSQTGKPTGLIAARSPEQLKERRLLSLVEKRPLLVDPKNVNGDYLTGLDLLVDDEAGKLTPPWVIASTRAWLKEQDEGGPSNPNRAPLAAPHRCIRVKSDGVRCMLWSSGRIKDGGLCRMHLKSARKPGEDVERARRKLMQSAPYAVDVLEELMESADVEQVRLKASTEILDRAGVRGGMDIGLDVEVTDARTPAQIVAERLARLSAGAAALQERLAHKEADEDQTVVEAQIVEETDDTGKDNRSDK